MNLHLLERREEAETVFWLDLAKRVLSGEVSPDEARDLLDRDRSYSERSDDDNWLGPLKSRQ